MLDFAWPWLFAALPLPLLVRRLWRPASRSIPALKVPFFDEVVALSANPTRLGTPGRRQLLLPGLIWILLILACARPQWLGEPIALPLSGRDLMLAIDISGSMEIPDFNLQGQEVTRLEVVKTTATDFIKRREGDHIGLILFGSQAYMQTPLTFDVKTVRTMLDDATIGLAGKETAIGDAIGLAVKRLRKGDVENRVLVLLTDGANTAGELDPLKAAELATGVGLKIYTIGIGAEAMRVSVPTLLGSQIVNPSRDLDEKTLRRIAEMTGGAYFRAKDTSSLEDIYQQLDQLEPQETDTELFRPTQALFYWPLGVAMLLSMFLLWRLMPLRLTIARKDEHSIPAPARPKEKSL